LQLQAVQSFGTHFGASRVVCSQTAWWGNNTAQPYAAQLTGAKISDKAKVRAGAHQ